MTREDGMKGRAMIVSFCRNSGADILRSKAVFDSSAEVHHAAGRRLREP